MIPLSRSSIAAFETYFLVFPKPVEAEVSKGESNKKGKNGNKGKKRTRVGTMPHKAVEKRKGSSSSDSNAHPKPHRPTIKGASKKNYSNARKARTQSSQKAFQKAYERANVP